MRSNPALKLAPFGRWDAPTARPLASRYAALSVRGITQECQAKK